MNERGRVAAPIQVANDSLELRASKNHGKAAVAVARHLADASWWVLSKMQVYRVPAAASISSPENGSAR
jgi:hypothetical protein